MEGNASFGMWVRERRRALDLTQAALAARVACATITIRKIESDERRPSAQVAGLLADALDIPDEDRDRFVAVARGALSALRLRLTSPVDRRPHPLTSMLGRSEELQDLLELAAFAGGPARLITITGPPGVGKTRTAVELGERARSKFDLPSLFVDLSAATSGDQVMARIAASVPVPAGPAGDRTEAAMAALEREALLLVLDNFEHVIEAGGVVVRLLERCPTVTCVVTSRVRLDVYGEYEYALDPLAVPPPGVTPSRTSLREWPAVDLFVQRAAAGRRGSLSDSDLAHAAEICRLLDGLPLAIELAAGRVRSTPIDRLAARLAQDVRSIDVSTVARSGQQRSLSGALRWSHDLLTPEAREALGAAAVFVSGCAVQGIAAVLGIDLDDAEQRVAELTDHGLAREVAGRVRLLTVVRAFALGMMPGDTAAAREAARSRYVADLVAEHAASVEAWSNDSALAAFDREIDDIDASLRWAFGPGGAPAVGARILIALGPYLALRGRLAESVAWLDLALAETEEPARRVPLLFMRAECAFGSGALADARDMFREAERLARRSGDTRWLPQILGDIGMLFLIEGRPDDAVGPLEESVALSLGSGTREGRALSHMRLSRLALLRGDLDEAHRRNDLAAALYREAGDSWGDATTESNRGDFALAAGRPGEALRFLAAAIDRYLEGGFDWYAATRLDTVGVCFAALDRERDAAAAFGASDAWLADLGMPHNPMTASGRPAAERGLREALGDRVDTAMARGARWPRDRVGLARRLR